MAKGDAAGSPTRRGGFAKLARAEAEAVFQKEQRRKLKELRQERRAARQEKRAALGAVKAECDKAIPATDAWTRRSFKKKVERARTIRDTTRQRVRTTCRKKKTETKAEADRRIAEAEAAAAREASEQKQLRGWERHAVQKARVRRSSAEARSESDDEVRHNIDPSLAPLWEQVKRSIRGTTFRTRTEAFEEYVQEHPEEVAAAQAELVPDDDDFAAQEAAYYADEQRRRANPSPRRPRRMHKSLLSEGAGSALVAVALLGGIGWLVWRDTQRTASAAETTENRGPGDGAPFLVDGDTVLVASDVPNEAAAAEMSDLFAALVEAAPGITFLPVPIPLSTEGRLSLRPLQTQASSRPGAAVLLLWTGDASNHQLEAHPTESELGVSRLVEVAPEGTTFTPEQADAIRRARTPSRHYYGLELPASRGTPKAYAAALLADLRNPTGIPSGRRA